MTAQRIPPRLPASRRRRRLRLALVGAFAISLAIAACIPAATRSSGDLAAAGSPPPAATASPAPSGPTPRPSFVPPTPTPQPTFFMYAVARGDNLTSIAHRFGTTARSIAFWNRATYPSLDPESPSYKPGLLQVGWSLMVIPNAVFDEQELPEPSDLIGPQPTPTPSDNGDATASDDLGPIDPNAP
jgi:LysM domain-containing protein